MPEVRDLRNQKGRPQKIMKKSKTTKPQKAKKSQKPCPSGFHRVNGVCVQAGIGPEYRP